jgi:AraC family transcriptional regulator
VYPWLAANDQLGQPRYGICLDDPTITAPDKCRYDAGVEVRGEITVSGNSQTTTILGGQYAVTANGRDYGAGQFPLLADCRRTARSMAQPDGV